MKEFLLFILAKNEKLNHKRNEKKNNKIKKRNKNKLKKIKTS